MTVNIIDMGNCGYQKAWDIQVQMLRKRQQGEIGDTLMWVEHPPVITLGRQGDSSHIVISEKYLGDMGISIFRTDRGGDVTYHGPGQIVGYPIISLREKGMGIKAFVRGLEEVFLCLLKDQYNIEARRDMEHTGVWVENEKIAAIGLAVKRGITMHGFAFNVNTNLEHFKLIVPCGIYDKGVTSLEKLTGKTVDAEVVKKSIGDYFMDVFRYGDHRHSGLDEIILYEDGGGAYED